MLQLDIHEFYTKFQYSLGLPRRFKMILAFQINEISRHIVVRYFQSKGKLKGPYKFSISQIELNCFVTQHVNLYSYLVSYLACHLVMHSFP